MKILTALGVVEVKRGDGTYIVSKITANTMDAAMFSLLFNSSSIDEVVEIRQLLDEAVLRLAITKCTDEQIRHLQALTDELGDCLAGGRHEEAARIDFAFHKYMLACCNNSFLNKIVLNIYGIFEKSIKDTIDKFSVDSKASRYHQMMIDCIIARDPSSVASIIEESLLVWKKTV